MYYTVLNTLLSEEGWNVTLQKTFSWSLGNTVAIEELIDPLFP